MAVPGTGSSTVHYRQEALLPADYYCRRLLWHDAVGTHGADALCLPGDAGTAVSDCVVLEDSEQCNSAICAGMHRKSVDKT